MATETPDAQRIKNALSVIIELGGIDGAHHKTWVLDQAVRALCGCSETLHEGCREPNDEYDKLIRDACAGEDTYVWDVGIAP